MRKQAEERGFVFARQQHILGSKRKTDVSNNTKVGRSNRKAFYRELRHVINNSDVILQVLDARDPQGTRCPALEQRILRQYPDKRVLIILNKIDLVPRDVVRQWVAHLSKEFPTVPFKSITAQQQGGRGHFSHSQCLGADTLLRLLKGYASRKGVTTHITAGVVGYPNVGKSSVINSLKKAKAVGVSSVPGFTRQAQAVQLDRTVRIIDCPGVLFASASQEADALRSSLNVENLDDPVSAVEVLLRRCQWEQLMRLFRIPAFQDSAQFLEIIGRKYGKFTKGSIVNHEAAARVVLQSWSQGKIPFFTAAPAEDASEPVLETGQATVVRQWAEEFDLQQLLEDRDKDLNITVPSYIATDLVPLAGASNTGSTDFDEMSALLDAEDGVTATTTTAEAAEAGEMEEDVENAEEIDPDALENVLLPGDEPVPDGDDEDDEDEDAMQADDDDDDDGEGEEEEEEDEARPAQIDLTERRRTRSQSRAGGRSEQVLGQNALVRKAFKKQKKDAKRTFGLDLGAMSL
eukprot:gnl/Trimastix_PCT/901.p1 GENE.gnl/Trimastix_PCT/901~~gnl/Trimastix_PCT/901.p1  ORF type:complete len:556 (-),score=245.81 gnl/Trimastix_PCT/901:210-1766(-)